MSEPNFVSDADRLTAAITEARELAYALLGDQDAGPPPITHSAHAGPVIGQPVVARYLASSTSAAEAAEAAVRILRGVVERGDPWPTR